MLFSSVLFLFVFLPLTLILYYIVPRKGKNLILFVCSLIFYAWGEPVYILLMLFSSTVDYVCGLLIDKGKINNNKKLQRIALIASIIVNLSLLATFKYADFFIINANTLFSSSIPLLNLGLPLGISFYTFQSMSYTIDCYRGEVAAQKNFITYSTYVSLFPQLVAGPIVRYKSVEYQMEHRKESLSLFSEGVIRFIIGLSKKMLIANNLGYFWAQIQALPESEVSSMTAWLGIILFPVQLYFDFSGYSDMAIGLGKMFGFKLIENFNYPFIAKSITEFWRRWHMSLGTWFKEYVYIPLGGNRKGSGRTYFNLFLTWFLTGLWHGATFTNVFWGLWSGIFIVLERAFLLDILERIPKFISRLYTTVLMCIGLLFLAYDDIAPCFSFIGKAFGINASSFADERFLYFLLSSAVLIVLALVGATPIVKNSVLKIKAKYDGTLVYSLSSMLIIAVLFFVCTAFLISESFNPFLYFRF